MRGTRVFACLVGVATALALGCGSKPRIREQVDVSFLSKMPEREQINFKLAFSRWLPQDAAVMERVWALAGEPPADVAAVWHENGLRIAWASGDDAKAIRAAFKRMPTLRQSQQLLVVPSRGSFEAVIGHQVPSTSLVYSSGGTTVFSDVSDLQQALRIAPEMSADGFRIKISPFFYTGTGRGAVTDIEGAVAAVPFSEGGIILVGAADDPQEFRLGSLLRHTDPDGTWSTLVAIEPKLTY